LKVFFSEPGLDTRRPRFPPGRFQALPDSASERFAVSNNALIDRLKNQMIVNSLLAGSAAPVVDSEMPLDLIVE
jgi:hypothetical protein